MQTNIYLTEESEKNLKQLKKVAVVNEISDSKASLINLAISISADFIEHMDSDDFKQVTNLKK